MAFKGTDVQYIGPVYVDWTKKFKDGFDLTAVKSYLTEKNQQWILDRQSKPETPKTTLQSLSDMFGGRFETMRNDYDQLVQIRKSYPSARQEWIDATKGIQKINEEFSYFDKTLAQIDADQLSYNQDPDQWESRIPFHLVEEGNIWLDIMQQDFDSPKSSIAGVEFKDGKMYFTSKSSGKEFTYEQLRKPIGNDEELVDGFEAMYFDRLDGLTFLAASNTQEAQGRAGEISNFLRKADINDHYHILWGMDFTYDMTPGDNTDEDKRISPLNSDLFETAFKATFTNAEQLMPKLGDEWKNWVNPRIAQEMCLKLAPGKTVEQSVKDFHVQYWNEINRQIINAGIKSQELNKTDENDPFYRETAGMQADIADINRDAAGYLAFKNSVDQEVFKGTYKIDPAKGDGSRQAFSQALASVLNEVSNTNTGAQVFYDLESAMNSARRRLRGMSEELYTRFEATMGDETKAQLLTSIVTNPSFITRTGSRGGKTVNKTNVEALGKNIVQLTGLDNEKMQVDIDGDFYTTLQENNLLTDKVEGAIKALNQINFSVADMVDPSEYADLSKKPYITNAVATQQVKEKIDEALVQLAEAINEEFIEENVIQGGIDNLKDEVIMQTVAKDGTVTLQSLDIDRGSLNTTMGQNKVANLLRKIQGIKNQNVSPFTTIGNTYIFNNRLNASQMSDVFQVDLLKTFSDNPEINTRVLYDKQ